VIVAGRAVPLVCGAGVNALDAVALADGVAFAAGSVGEPAGVGAWPGGAVALATGLAELLEGAVPRFIAENKS
jgi:hypothetical protein